MKPNGLVFAASITSQTSMSILWHISAISLTRPMFTARNVFSSSLTISATRVELTGTTCSHRRAVERRGHLGARRPDAADDLRDVLGVELLVARIDPLGRKRQEEVDVRLEPLRLEHRLHDFVGRARIGRRLEDDRADPRLQRRGHRFDREHDVRQIRILGLAQRRRHADVDRVHRRRARSCRSSRAACRLRHARGEIRFGRRPECSSCPALI